MSDPDGWFLIAYERELTNEIATAVIGGRRLVIVRTHGALRVFDAACPHRGANLALGQLESGDAIRCAFHGYRIGLGACGEHGLKAREYTALSLGGLVFARLRPEHDHGFADFMRELDATHYIVPGFLLTTSARAATVIENAFDQAHFKPVHGVLEEPRLTASLTDAGTLLAEGTFTVPASPWQRAAASRVEVPYRAVAFSPWLVVSTLGGSHPYSVITGATPRGEGETLIRLSVAVPASQGAPPDDDLCRYLLAQSKKGLELDRAIWDNSELGGPAQLAADHVVRAFHLFALGFTAEGKS